MTENNPEAVEKRIKQFLVSVESALKANGKSAEHRALVRDELEQHIRSQLASLTCAVTPIQLEAVLERMDQPQAYGDRTALKWSRIVQWSFPAFVSVISLSICGLSLLLQATLPWRLEVILKELNVHIPWPTEFIIHSYWALLLPLIFAATCVYLLARLQKISGTQAWLMNTILSLALLVISGLYLMFQGVAILAPGFVITEALSQQT
jgi:hypothetical protein